MWSSPEVCLYSRDSLTQLWTKYIFKKCPFTNFVNRNKLDWSQNFVARDEKYRKVNILNYSAEWYSKVLSTFEVSAFGRSCQFSPFTNQLKRPALRTSIFTRPSSVPTMLEPLPSQSCWNKLFWTPWTKALKLLHHWIFPQDSPLSPIVSLHLFLNSSTDYPWFSMVFTNHPISMINMPIGRQYMFYNLFLRRLVFKLFW